MPVSSIIGLIALGLLIALTTLLMRLCGKDDEGRGFPNSRGRGE